MVIKMRAVVLSDSHGTFAPLEKAIFDHPEANTVIFLGDGARQFDDTALLYPEKKFYSVCGNCDFGSVNPVSLVINLGGVTVFATHGHIQSVKYGLYDLKSSARQNGAKIALFGHTHIAMTDYDDGLYLMNPGSVSRPASGHASYGLIDITPAGIVTNIVEFK